MFFSSPSSRNTILQLEKTSHIRGFYLYKLATGQIPGKDIVKNTGIIKGLRDGNAEFFFFLFFLQSWSARE